jgi:hypothetical protein
MKKRIMAAIGGAALGLTLLAAPADARPADKPNTTCMQFGIAGLKSVGLFSEVARNGLAIPGTDLVLPLAQVLAVHRNDPATANVVLKAYGFPAEAVDAACPAG